MKYVKQKQEKEPNAHNITDRKSTNMKISTSSFKGIIRNTGKLLLATMVVGTGMLINAQSTFAQVSGYSFTQSSGTFTALPSPVLAVATNSDDVNSAAVTIPFTFTYDGVAYTQVKMNSNGHIRMGNVNPTSSYFPLSTASNTGAIAGFGRDGRAFGGIGYQTLGTTPNQIFVIQYLAFRPQYNSSANFMDFQIRLHETTNEVEIIYGSSTRASTYTGDIGLRGAIATGDFNVRTTTTNWAATTAGATNAANVRWSTSVGPASGQTYTWTPPVACSGTPATPTLTTNGVTDVCDATIITVNSSGAETGIGITYQWQISTDAGTPVTWAGVGGQTTATLT